MLRSIKGITSLAKAWKGATYTFGQMLRETGIALERGGMYFQGDFAYRDELCRYRRLVSVGDKLPIVKQDAWIAPNSSLFGDVTLGPDSTVWYGTVVRGDQNSVKIGIGCSIGDRVTIQASSLDTWDGDKPVTIGDLAVIEAGALLYACTIGEHAIIGMGSVIHAGAVIGKGAIIEAGSVVLKGTVVPEGEVWGGNPAKLVRKTTAEDIKEHGRLIQLNKLNQVKHSFEFSKTPQELYDAWRLKQIGGPMAKTAEPTE